MGLCILSMLSWLLWTSYFPSSAGHIQRICLQNAEGPVYYLKTLFVDGIDLPIRIEVSDRISHQLTSTILSIILREVARYKTTLVYKTMSTTKTLQGMTGCKEPFHCNPPPYGFVPDAMVNVETWLMPGFNLRDWVATRQVEDGGPLGPLGRYDWYIPEWTVRCKWKNDTVIIDHWRVFQDRKLVQTFDLWNDTEILHILYDPDNALSYCRASECVDGIYEPEWCKKKASCATLLADYPGPTMNILKRTILKLHLRVRVVWLGAHLEKVVLERTSKRKPVLFYNWKPNILTSLGNFTAVTFPQCENDPIGCSFGVNQLQKVAWSKLRRHAPEVFDIIRNMNFTHEQYLELLRNYKESTQWSSNVALNVETVACQWLNQKDDVWKPWIPSDMAVNTSLYIAGIFPMSGIYWEQKGIVTAAQMAIDAINRNSRLLKEFELHLLISDGACSPDVALNCFINYVIQESYDKIIGILGPACSNTLEPIVGVARHFHTIIISYGAEGGLSNDQEKYPYFFRTIPNNSYFRYVYRSLFKTFGWHRVAAVSEAGQRYSQYLSGLRQDLSTDGIALVADLKMPGDGMASNVSSYLRELQNKNARIIIAELTAQMARALMCQAYIQDMTAWQAYQWFLPTWYTEDWYDTDYYNSKSDHDDDRVECATEQMREAIDGYMSFSFKFYANDDFIMQEGKKQRDWMNSYRKRAARDGYNASRYGGYAYDAVWVYAMALDRLLRENPKRVFALHRQNTTRRFAELLNETDMAGTTGHVYFEGSSRLTQIVLWQWHRGHMHSIGTYTPSSFGERRGHLMLNETAIVWLNHLGVKPNDGDGSIEALPCPLEKLRAVLNVSCDVAHVIVNLIGFLLLTLVVIVPFVFFKRRYEKKLKITEDRIMKLGLFTSCGISCLDKWEIAREQVVINRNIGEGAFGVVYGGEALIENEGWLAVAVKTLKIGASVEEKLDFLGEAEMMKRFDHMNIVRLLGVCTVDEPVYTVMEFMLYGDLKTFLLARRHLVSEKESEEYEEVSDRQLTAMALDIARGLCYLSQLNYVHRDLACRNCLVDAGFTVKIADFGMCRPMYDSDYYKFNKKGMLPVRWMAPESLRDGIFTTMSDAWSFGVVLYEMITFGSFPYQGLSNAQVLEYVTGFNTLPVPDGCHIQLKELLLRCWDRLPQKRPRAREVVEILANHSELISPCLDLPVASMELGTMPSVDIAIPCRKRLHSVCSVRSLGKRPQRCSASHTNLHVQRAQSGSLRSVSGAPWFSPTGALSRTLKTMSLHLKEKPAQVQHTRSVSDYFQTTTRL